jgi:RNA polymerase sigma-70 factor (ECF subfamily)
MCLHAARMPSRLDEAGDLTPFFEQDRSRWDAALIAQGRRLLDQSAAGSEVTPYHIEAAIAGVHAAAPSAAQTDWGAIVRLYDVLLALRPSPVVALHRAIAVGQQQGPERGLEAIAAIDGCDRLDHYPFYAAALGEMELARGQPERARQRFGEALALARNPTERRFLEKRLTACAAPQQTDAPHE